MIIDGFTIQRMINVGAWKAMRGDQELKSADLVIGSNTVDLTLGSKFLVPKAAGPVDLVDYKDNLVWEEIIPSPEGKFCLQPKMFALATVQERFDLAAPVILSNGSMYLVAPMFEGRSTTARMGLAVHVTAGNGDYGFNGNFTMELVNLGPMTLILTVGMRIAQLSFQSVTPDAVKMRYKGAYSDKHVGGPFPPSLGRDRFMPRSG